MQKGLYLSKFERENCGAGFICNLDGRKTNQIIHDALNILVKLDRSTMAEGLEGRVPFIDKRICEFSMKGLIKNSKISYFS